jgi:hypothetical protein
MNFTERTTFSDDFITSKRKAKLTMTSADPSPSPPKKTVLDITEKRNIAFSWFQSKGRIRDLDAGRAFVRRAAADLDLRSLRMVRLLADSEGDLVRVRELDATALAKIGTYRPAKPPPRGDAAAGKMNRGAVRALLLAFFDDAAMTPLGPFLRSNGAAAGGRRAKRDILGVARSAQIRRLRRRRDGGAEIRSAAAAAIDQALRGSAAEAKSCAAKAEPLTQALAASLGAIALQDGTAPRARAGGQADRGHKIRIRRAKRTQKRAESMNRRVTGRRAAASLSTSISAKTPKAKTPKGRAFHPDPRLPPLLIHWFDHRDKTMADVLAEADLLQEKAAMRQVVRFSGLRRLRRNGARAEAMRAIEALLPVASEAEGAVAAVAPPHFPSSAEEAWAGAGAEAKVSPKKKNKKGDVDAMAVDAMVVDRDREQGCVPAHEEFVVVNID